MIFLLLLLNFVSMLLISLVLLLQLLLMLFLIMLMFLLVIFGILLPFWSAPLFLQAYFGLTHYSGGIGATRSATVVRGRSVMGSRLVCSGIVAKISFEIMLSSACIGSRSSGWISIANCTASLSLVLVMFTVTSLVEILKM